MITEQDFFKGYTGYVTTIGDVTTLIAVALQGKEWQSQVENITSRK
jgi:hypothetical protein